MAIIWCIIALIIIFSVYMDNRTATRNKNNILLGVTLPFLGTNNKEVMAVVNSYKKANIKFFILSIIIFLPSLFIKYMSFQMLYFFLWVFLVIYGGNKVLCSYNEKLRNLKRANNWFSSTKQLLTIDTEVTRMRDKMPVSKLWFIPSIGISLIPIWIAFNSRDFLGNSIIVVSFTAIIATVIFIGIHKAYSDKNTEIYSSDTKVNLVCNTIYKRMWTLGCVIAATLQSISMLIVFLLIMTESPKIIIFLLVVLVPAVVIVLGIYFINNKVVREQNRLISTSENPIYIDNDEYWKNNVYNNPNDPRARVEKRVGYGFEYNLATKKGRLMAYGSYVIGTFIVVGVLFMLFLFDFSRVVMSIDDELVKISAPVYGVEFKVDDIKDVEMITDISVGFKTNGISTNQYSYGHFNVKDYGPSILFIHHKNTPYIAIKVENKYVFINGTSKEETEKYYKELIKVKN